MINRELKSGLILTFDDSLDEYGQPNTSNPTLQEPCELTLRIYKHSQVEDVRFNEVTHTALILNKNITDSNKISVDGNTYSIKFVNNEGRLTQLFLVKDKK